MILRERSDPDLVASSGERILSTKSGATNSGSDCTIIRRKSFNSSRGNDNVARSGPSAELELRSEGPTAPLCSCCHCYHPRDLLSGAATPSELSALSNQMGYGAAIQSSSVVGTETYNGGSEVTLTLCHIVSHSQIILDRSGKKVFVKVTQQYNIAFKSRSHSLHFFGTQIQHARTYSANCAKTDRTMYNLSGRTIDLELVLCQRIKIGSPRVPEGPPSFNSSSSYKVLENICRAALDEPSNLSKREALVKEKKILPMRCKFIQQNHVFLSVSLIIIIHKHPDNYYGCLTCPLRSPRVPQGPPRVPQGPPRSPEGPSLSKLLHFNSNQKTTFKFSKDLLEIYKKLEVTSKIFPNLSLSVVNFGLKPNFESVQSYPANQSYPNLRYHCSGKRKGDHPLPQPCVPESRINFPDIGN
eukprot:sb/3465124/